MVCPLDSQMTKREGLMTSCKALTLNFAAVFLKGLRLSALFIAAYSIIVG